MDIETHKILYKYLIDLLQMYFSFTQMTEKPVSTLNQLNKINIG
jgi:hypothetical protein